MNSQYGTFETITYEYLVSGVKMRLGIKASNEDDPFIMDSVNRGVKRLRNLGMFIPATVTLPINGFKAKLPMGFIRFNHSVPIIFVDEFGQAIINGVAQAPSFINNTFASDSPFPTSQQLIGGTVNIVNGYLLFSDNITASFVKIACLMAALDDNGDILIPAIAEDTLTAFACREYCIAFEVKTNMIPLFDNEWKQGKQGLKGIFNGSQGIDNPFIAYKQKSLC